MGSCETGRAEISTLESAARPAALIVHDCLLFDTHVIYCSTSISLLYWSQLKQFTYRVIEPGRILKPVDGEATRLILVAILVDLRNDTRSLLVHATRVRVLIRECRVINDLVRGRVEPVVPSVERLRTPISS